MYNPDHKLAEYLKSKGIVPEAYSPLGSVGSPLLNDEVAVEIASKHNLTPADVLLAWLRTSTRSFFTRLEKGWFTHRNVVFGFLQTKKDAWSSQNPLPLLVSKPT